MDVVVRAIQPALEKELGKAVVVLTSLAPADEQLRCLITEPADGYHLLDHSRTFSALSLYGSTPYRSLSLTTMIPIGVPG